MSTIKEFVHTCTQFHTISSLKHFCFFVEKQKYIIIATQLYLGMIFQFFCKRPYPTVTRVYNCKNPYVEWISAERILRKEICFYQTNIPNYFCHNKRCFSGNLVFLTATKLRNTSLFNIFRYFCIQFPFSHLLLLSSSLACNECVTLSPRQAWADDTPKSLRNL